MDWVMYCTSAQRSPVDSYELWQFSVDYNWLLSCLLHKNEGEKNMNTSLSLLLFLNSVNSASLVRKSLMTTKAWQVRIAVLLYNKKKTTKCLKIWKLGWHSPSPRVNLTGCAGWSACWPLEHSYCAWLILCFRL